MGEACSSLSDCCGTQSCGPETFGSTDRFCGVGMGRRCTEDRQCIGMQNCVNGSCACRVERESCASSVDCCGSLICVDGSCRMPPMM